MSANGKHQFGDDLSQADIHPATGTGPGTPTVTTSGAIASSDDPSTNPSTTTAQKLQGDLKGAVNGTAGSLQAAVGAMLQNKEMEPKGMEKMSEEDQRLGAKHGVMPVGTELRNEEVDGSE